MHPAPPPVLRFLDLLHGTYMAVARKTKKEGRRCARYYHSQGTYPEPPPLREVQPGDVVMLHSVADFFHHKPAWRLYFFLNISISDYDATLEPCNWYQFYDAFERAHLDTPWGALFHAVHPRAPASARVMSARLSAVLRFWDSLSVPRYQHKTFNRFYTLEELITDIYGRTLNAWCPKAPPTVRAHLQATVERMSQATREDCLQTILRVMPSILTGPYKLDHREELGDPALQIERLSALTPEEFERISSAYSSPVYAQMRRWDEELGLH